MTPIAYETVQYLRKVNTVFNDKNRVFDMMTNVLSALPDFARDQVIAEMLPNIKFNTEIQVNADGTEIRKSNAPEFLERSVELDAIIEIAWPPFSERGAMYSPNEKHKELLRRVLSVTADKAHAILQQITMKPGVAMYRHYIRGSELDSAVKTLTDAGFFAR